MVTPDGKKVYVANCGSDTVSVIDTSNDTVVAALIVGDEPIALAITPDGSKVYVVNLSGTVSVIDTSNDTVVAAPNVGVSPIALAITPDGSKVYVVNLTSGTVSVIDTTTDTVVATPNIGVSPIALAITPDGSKVYVASRLSGTVSVIDTSNDTVVAAPNVGVEPLAIVITDVLPPFSITGKQKTNISPMQVERSNLIKWTPPLTVNPPAQYKIYRDAGLTVLVAIVPASAPLTFSDPNRRKKQSYVYYVVSENSIGDISIPISIIVKSG